MTDLKAIYLYPQSGFRANLRSDTLWGMLCWGIRAVYGEKALVGHPDAFIDSFLGEQPAYLLSSAFPFIQNEKGTHHFFPRPILPKADQSEQKMDPEEARAGLANRKLLKKVQYLEQKDLMALASGTMKTDQLNDHLLDRIETDGLLQPKIKEVAVTHNTIDRLRGGTLEKEERGQLFHVGEQFIQANLLKGKAEKQLKGTHRAGLFFLVKGDPDKIMGALRFLETIGFGGDRNTGKGRFEVKGPQPFTWPEIKEPNAMTNLSLYFPKGSLADQPQPELSRYRHSPWFQYELEERVGAVSFGGYGKIAKPLRVFFKEGSLFPYHPADSYGQSSLILPSTRHEALPHDIYQYGHGFMLPMHLQSSH